MEFGITILLYIAANTSRSEYAAVALYFLAGLRLLVGALKAVVGESET